MALAAQGPTHNSRDILKEVKKSWENKIFYVHIRNMHLPYLLKLVVPPPSPHPFLSHFHQKHLVSHDSMVGTVQSKF